MEEDLKFLKHFKEALHLNDVDPSSYSPLVLAYIGDAVYELMIRTKLINDPDKHVDRLNIESASLVNAKTQSDMIGILEGELTQDEKNIYRRARNAKPASVSKHATVPQYRRATGFEALIGYLYVTQQYDRLTDLVGMGLDKLEENKLSDEQAGSEET